VAVRTTTQDAESVFKPSQAQYLLARFKEADNLIATIEQMLACSASKSLFPQYRMDFAPSHQGIAGDHLAQLRARMIRALQKFDIESGIRKRSARQSIGFTLASMRNAFEQLRPEYMRAYGEVSPAAADELNRLADELQRIIAKLDLSLAKEQPGAA
jgi:hypothetical protein